MLKKTFFKCFSTIPLSNTTQKQRKKVTLITLRELYKKNIPISMLTAHDYPSGLNCEKSMIDTVLVGDSLGMVALGYNSTTEVTMDDMIHHCKAVARAVKTPFLIGDMPFGSYQISKELALKNAIRFIQEGNSEAVKLEGGIEMAETIRYITKMGIPVLGHIGLTPQSQTALGGYRVQGKTHIQAMKLVDDAIALQDAGCFAIVLEVIPPEVAQMVTKTISIPTIGIGAGNLVSGQVLVQQDMLGIFDRFVPKFCKLYANMNRLSIKALTEYNNDVKSRTYPGVEHTYPMSEEELILFMEEFKKRKL